MMTTTHSIRSWTVFGVLALLASQDAAARPWWHDNQPPLISGAPAYVAMPGQRYSFAPVASDPDGNRLKFSIQNKPRWASFDSSTGQLDGTPMANAGTTSNILISVTDGKASASLPAFSIAVVGDNSPPTISGSPSTSATVGTAYSFTPNASDSNGDSLTFTITNKPAWATFYPSTGRLVGTPSTANIGSTTGIVIAVSDGRATAQLAPFSIAVTGAANRAPTISGSAPTAVTADSAYAFQPTASDADGDTLRFMIANKPSWAAFDAATGKLAGRPSVADVGTTTGVQIAVTDGTSTATLPAFSITVQAVASGSATLTWTPPTQNTDGSPLTTLSGYKVYWGTSAGSYTSYVTLTNPGLSSYVVSNLPRGSYYFSVKALSSTGAESDFSNAATKAIQ